MCAGRIWFCNQPCSAQKQLLCCSSMQAVRDTPQPLWAIHPREPMRWSFPCRRFPLLPLVLCLGSTEPSLVHPLAHTHQPQADQILTCPRGADSLSLTIPPALGTAGPEARGAPLQPFGTAFLAGRTHPGAATSRSPPPHGLVRTARPAPPLLSRPCSPQCIPLDPVLLPVFPGTPRARRPLAVA